MPEIKKFRLGGAGGYSLVAYGSKTRAGVVYERIELVDEHYPNGRQDVTRTVLPLGMSCTAVDFHHLDRMLTEARKHLAMGAA